MEPKSKKPSSGEATVGFSVWTGILTGLLLINTSLLVIFLGSVL
jgi:hypothetical protein